MVFVLFRLAVGGVFVYSGWQKLLSPVEEFEAVIGAYQFLPSGTTGLAALFVPWLELIAGTFLVLGYLTRASAGALSLLLGAFIILLARSVMLKLPIHECGCFGSALALTPLEALALDGILLLMAVIVAVRVPRRFGLDAWLLKG